MSELLGTSYLAQQFALDVEAKHEPCLEQCLALQSRLGEAAAAVAGLCGSKTVASLHTYMHSAGTEQDLLCDTNATQ